MVIPNIKTDDLMRTYSYLFFKMYAKCVLYDTTYCMHKYGFIYVFTLLVTVTNVKSNYRIFSFNSCFLSTLRRLFVAI